MNILWVSEYPPDKGAVSDYSGHLTRHLAEEGNLSIDVLSVDGEEPGELPENVEVIGSIPENPEDWSRFMDQDYDLAHFHYYLPHLRSFLKYSLKGGKHPKLLMTLHDVPTELKHRILFYVFRNVVLLTDSTEQEFRSEYSLMHRLIGHNVYRAPYLGLDRDLPERVRNRDIETDLNPEATNIVCPGFIHEKKGFHKVVEALPDLLEEVPDLHLSLAGGKHREGSDEYITGLEERIADLGVEDRVTITGLLPTEDHVNAYIMEADAVALPFDEISQSATLAKTLALGSVPVVTPLDTLTPVIEDYGGIAIAEDTPAALRDGILRALSDPPEIRADAFRADHSWEENAAAYINIYQKMGYL